jgi:hypothetical protein
VETEMMIENGHNNKNLDSLPKEKNEDLMIQAFKVNTEYLVGTSGPCLISD